MHLAILHGPNLNRLGERDPAKYGVATLDDITRDVDATAARLDVTALHFQSNHEGALTEWVQDRQPAIDGYVVNPAGLASYGYAWLDALSDTGRPFAVVHISQWHAHDGKDRTDVFAAHAAVYLAGAGWRGYSLALDALVHRLREP
ncbi:type II 3-dehydroquinate dehydratase [Saccharothrix sp. AJ9571]|nr:type II 3-dehydroquinate dehydratase [Saccharothrix sp. AJ9571]